MAVIPVTHYGLHMSPTGVWFLEQGRKGANALGLREHSPFVVTLPSGKRHCNHQIPLASPVVNNLHWDMYASMHKDPLVRAMVPIPKGNDPVIHIDDNSDVLMMYLVALSRLSSPIYPIVRQASTINIKSLANELCGTNIQPFVITHCNENNSRVVNEAVNFSVTQPRRVVLVGNPSTILPKRAIHCRTRVTDIPLVEFSMIPWESIGAEIIRGFMRNVIDPDDVQTRMPER